MTVNEAIERVNMLKDNGYDDSVIKGFIEDCDKRIYKEVINTHKNNDSIKPYEERYPLSGEDELLADDAYTQFYIFYAICQIDVFNGEYDRYTNNMILYNSHLSDFKAYYNRTHMPIGAQRMITE